MLTYSQLVEFEASVRGRPILSVYISGALKDPAEKRRWRIDLRHAFDTIEARLKTAPHAEREAFAKCRRAVTEQLRAYRVTVRAPGWAGFFTIDGPVMVTPLPMATPTMATWTTSACIAPYIRLIKETRDVIVAIVDAKAARLFRYGDRHVALVDTLRAHTVIEASGHMGNVPRQGFHTGTRGPTGTDESQRELREGTTRMLAETADRLATLAANGEWIVLGGIDTVAKAALRRLPAELASRTVFQAIDVHATKSAVAEIARAAASSLRNASDLERVNDAITGAERNARGVVGTEATHRALVQRQVRELFFTSAFLAEHPDEADEAVRMAFDNGAVVEHVSGEAADRVQQVGGMAARLWYVTSAAELVPAEATAAD